MAVLFGRTATTSRPPKTGNPSTQFACALARRRMQGGRFELSGRKAFAATALIMTSLARRNSIKTSRMSVQAMNAVSTKRLGVMVLGFSWSSLWAGNESRVVKGVIANCTFAIRVDGDKTKITVARHGLCADSMKYATLPL